MLMKVKQMVKRKTNLKGFTLVELVIVMAILGILASLAVPRFSSVLSDAKTSADEANKKLIKTAVELAYANGDLTDSECDGSTDLMSELATDGYLESATIEVPTDPTKKYTVTVNADAGAISSITFDTADK